MRTLMRAVALGMATVALAPALADTKAGVEAWNRGDYRGAVEQWRKAAIAGDPDAQFNMGQAYKLGRGVPVDMAMAESWYRKAAMQGHAQAEDNYGFALFDQKKFGEALPWLEKSVARGEPRAQLVLGTMLFNGDGVERDWVRAYALMVRSSAAGLPQGSQTLAEMDKYIPEDQRQKGIVLAHQYEARVARNDYQPEVAGGASGGPAPAPGPAVRPTDLPPSNYAPGFTARPAVGAPYAAPSDAPPEPKPARVKKPKPGKTPPPQIAYGGDAPPAPGASGGYPANGPAYGPGTGYAPPPAATDAPPPEPRPLRPAPQPVRPTPRPVATAPVAEAAGGGWRLQFGAFRDEGNARNLWATLKGKVSGLGGMQPYLRRTGGITKLQAGPVSSQAEAAGLCVAVKRAGSECVPVRP